MNSDIYARFFANTPFLKALFPFVIGIWLGGEFFVPFQYTMILSLLLLLVYIIVVWITIKKHIYRQRFVLGYILICLFIIIGYQYATLRAPKSINLNSKAVVTCKVLSISSVSDKSYKATVKLLNANSLNITNINDPRGYVYFSKKRYSSPPVLGSVMHVSGVWLPFDSPIHEYAFDYSNYLISQRIAFRILEYSSTLAYFDNKFYLSVFIEKMKDRLHNVYAKNGMGKDELAVLTAMFLGDKSDLSHEQKINFAKAGAMHLLAVSGLHVGIIYMLFSFILTKIFPRRYRKMKFTIILLILWVYALVAGFSPSVMRASIMFSVLGVGKLLNYKVSIFNYIAFSMFIILLIEPLSIYHIGFWLSHLAVASIIVFYPLINQQIHFRFKPAKWIWSIISVSLAAQIGTLPLVIITFNQFPVYFLLTNILLLPMATPILVLSIFSALFYFIPIVSQILIIPLNHLIRLMNYAVEVIEQLPHSTFEHLSISLFDMFVIYLIMLLTIITIENKILANLKQLLMSVVILLISQNIQAAIRPTSGVFVIKNRGSVLINMFSERSNEVFTDSDTTEKQVNSIFKGFWSYYHLPVDVNINKIDSTVVYRKAGKTDIAIVPNDIEHFHNSNEINLLQINKIEQTKLIVNHSDNLFTRGLSKIYKNDKYISDEKRDALILHID